MGALRELRARAEFRSLKASTPKWLRPLAAELFRDQIAFNRSVVDLLEEGPWLARLSNAPALVRLRLELHAHFTDQLRLPTYGLWSTLEASVKYSGLSLLKLTLRPALHQIERMNLALIEALCELNGRESSIAVARAKPEPLTVLSPVADWFKAQLQFQREVLELVKSTGNALRDYASMWKRRLPSAQERVQSRAALVAEPLPVSVVVVGAQSDDCRFGLAAFEGQIARSLSQASSEVVVRVPGDEELLPGALETFGRVFAQHPQVDLAYADHLLDGLPKLKPGFSPHYLWNENYVGGLIAVRREAALRWKLTEKQCALAWLLQPGLTDSQVMRVPWPMSARSSPYYDAAETGWLREFLRPQPSCEVSVENQKRHVRCRPVGKTSVTVVVPFQDQSQNLERLCRSFEKYAPGVRCELLLISCRSREPRTRIALEQLSAQRNVRVLNFDQSFNPSALKNFGAMSSDGDLLLFLDHGLEARAEGWLAELAGYALQPDVGAVGARLMHADGTLMHAGSVVGLAGLAGNVFARWNPQAGVTPFGSPVATRNWSAVSSACLLVKSELFRHEGGFNEQLTDASGDVELCLRFRRHGLRNLCVGHVELWHCDRPQDVATSSSENLAGRDLLRPLLESGDPYYHPMLSTDVGNGGPEI